MLKQIRRFLEGPDNSATSHRIGLHQIALPAGHALPVYQRDWRLYDKPIQWTTSALASRAGISSYIDIGANVGDTAAAVNSIVAMPTLCIEGDPCYWPFLERNAEVIGPQIEIEKAFIGTISRTGDDSLLARSAGTTAASTVLASNASGRLLFKPLGDILTSHKQFEAADFVKIDTDGCDFQIIVDNLPWLKQCGPALFFEYTVETSAASEAARLAIKGLFECGYSEFVVFDNFGNLVSRPNSLSEFERLSWYLLSHKYCGRAVYYIDVFANRPNRTGVGDTIEELYRKAVGEALC